MPAIRPPTPFPRPPSSLWCRTHNYAYPTWSTIHRQLPANIRPVRYFTQRPPHSQHKSPHPEDVHSAARPNSNSNPSYPSINFAELGANRAVKITVLVFLGILGAAETIFYAKAIYRYLVPPEPTSSEASSVEGSSTAAAEPDC